MFSGIWNGLANTQIRVRVTNGSSIKRMDEFVFLNLMEVTLQAKNKLVERRFVAHISTMVARNT